MYFNKMTILIQVFSQNGLAAISNILVLRQPELASTLLDIISKIFSERVVNQMNWQRVLWEEPLVLLVQIMAVVSL
tara:strand:+ start:331 stop:558 length:228 start_codon:yes stop_codon:yes gene_type:complete